MTNRIIGAAFTCVMSLWATGAFAQQTASGSGAMTTTHGGSGSGGQNTVSGTLTMSDPFHGQPPTGLPPTDLPPTFQRPTGMLPAEAPAGVRNGPQAFSVVLVVGEMEGTQAGDNVPAAARKALTDLKDFLPYKNYRLLDSQWTLCCGRGAIFSRLRGLDEQEYELQLSPVVTGTAEKPTVTVRFVLMEAAPNRGEDARQAEQLLKELQAAQDQLKHPVGVPSSAPSAERAKLLEQQLMSAGRRTPHASRQVIDASFRMDVGETVVVGTSRIQGDKALIALLTAVPPKGAASR